MAHLLGADAITLEYPTRRIFDAVSIGVDEGDRIGIVGRNGDGKSTLLSLLSGRLAPDAGRVTTRNGLTIGVLDQADQLDPSMSVRKILVGEMDDHEWASDRKVRDVISGLLPNIDWDAPAGDLSGGQRRRLALAALLMDDDEVLMLDEPTNHLDVEAISWLAEHLNQRWTRNAGALLVVTHDRWFLDEACQTTWEVHDETVDAFEGGYASYVLQRVERDRMASATEAKRQNLMKKELAWLRRGPPARTTKSKFRIAAANELIADVPPVRDKIVLQQMATSRLGKSVVDLINVSVSYGDNLVLQDVNWNIGPGERTGILGPNGAGKSTLLNLITGSLEPSTGKVKRGTTIKAATLTQESEELEKVRDTRVMDVIKAKQTTFNVGGKNLTPSQLLERLGFSTRHLSSRVFELSGGQKRRLQLLLILLNEPNVLVMDEPSNDLDTDMLAAMEDLLDTWPGTLIVVSHDRYLIERVTDQQYAILDGHLRHLPGGVEQYVDIRRRGASQPSDTPLSGSGLKAKQAEPSSSGISNSERQAFRKEMSAIERKLPKIPKQIERIHNKIAEHDQSDYEGLAVMAKEVIGLQEETTRLETRWLELSELLG